MDDIVEPDHPTPKRDGRTAITSKVSNKLVETNKSVKRSLRWQMQYRNMYILPSASSESTTDPSEEDEPSTSKPKGRNKRNPRRNSEPILAHTETSKDDSETIQTPSNFKDFNQMRRKAINAPLILAERRRILELWKTILINCQKSRGSRPTPANTKGKKGKNKDADFDPYPLPPWAAASTQEDISHFCCCCITDIDSMVARINEAIQSRTTCFPKNDDTPGCSATRCNRHENFTNLHQSNATNPSQITYMEMNLSFYLKPFKDPSSTKKTRTIWQRAVGPNTFWSTPDAYAWDELTPQEIETILAYAHNDLVPNIRSYYNVQTGGRWRNVFLTIEEAEKHEQRAQWKHLSKDKRVGWREESNLESKGLTKQQLKKDLRHWDRNNL
ncbi:hypothetical protein HDU97_003361 [Phlyctochytrium planicorne]|nr:hypothetical protein HDU97_003361 [Phlyctochytrium planicorne]